MEEEKFVNHDELYKHIESTEQFSVVESRGGKSRKKYRLIESFDTLDEARDFIVDTNYVVWYTKLPQGD